MLTSFELKLPSFIVNDEHPDETVCENWYPRYGYIFSAKEYDEEMVRTPTGISYSLEDVTWVRWKNGVMYKTTITGWPLALQGMTWNEAKDTKIYQILFR